MCYWGCEEITCKTLKLDDTKGHHVAFEGQEIHWPEIEADQIVVKQMSAKANYQAENLVQGNFATEDSAHYYPVWARNEKELLSPHLRGHLARLQLADRNFLPNYPEYSPNLVIFRLIM